ncbi:hypothetical protein [Sphingomonas qomolangmaensis]|uniref:Uncharacterized protein n=1 Tax=Sphingomonas qomolangmaensis TaxID=2918765 RepID=A0ABY5L776_9SPHN|nr:hypothetical protein [Sphingomonas qomolangmaensis]UUL82824.1 hypothetical protein NMP03_00845 [Sphingomonas qomolangmaensis]
MTIKLAAALAATLIAAPALADDVRQDKFTRDGQTYAYTIDRQEDSVVLSGRTLPQGDNFRFVVRGRTVRGNVEGRPVNFRIDKPLVAAPIQTAAR